MKGKIVVSTILLTYLMQASTIEGREPTPIQPLNDSQFQKIESFIILEPKTEFPRRKPLIKQVVPEPKFEVKSTSKPVREPVIKPTGKSLSGIASWYCKAGTSRCTRGHSGGLYAAIRRDLLFLRGKVISVCSSKCIHVKVIDCNCGVHANLIDLYSDAFRLLAPLSAGRIRVTIHW